MTQEQRKILLTIINPKKYGKLDVKNISSRVVKGKEMRKSNKFTKISRTTQNFFGSRISSKVIRSELPKWAKNETQNI